MTTSLPGAWSLITDSWHAFTKHWSLTVKYAAWLVLAVAIQQILFFFPEQSTAWYVALVLGTIVGVVIALWVSIRLYQVLLTLEAGKTVDAKTTALALSLVGPLLLVSFFEGLASLGGFILLVIPGIYVATRLAFSKFALLDQNIHGRAALVASWNMTKGRFWAIFGRQLAGGAVFAVGMMIILVVLMLLFSVVVGRDAVDALDESSGPVAFLFGLAQGIVQAAVLPLFAVFQVKLYNALKKIA